MHTAIALCSAQLRLQELIGHNAPYTSTLLWNQYNGQPQSLHIVAIELEVVGSIYSDMFSEQRLQCWGHWKEGSYMIVLMGEDTKLPRYILVRYVDSCRSILLV